MAFALRQVGHFALWLIPVYLTVYLYDALHVSFLWSLLLKWLLGFLLILATLRAEWNELRDGKQTRDKFYVDRIVKIGAVVVSLITAGWWREIL